MSSTISTSRSRSRALVDPAPVALDDVSEPAAQPDELDDVYEPTERNPQLRRERSAELTAQLLAADEAGGRVIRRRLVLLHLDAADGVARHYAGRGQDHQDLVQVARVGLVEASVRYDPSLGSFLGFALPTMMGVIRRHFRDRAWSVKPPRCIQEHAAVIARAREDLTHELLRWPTIPELAQHLELSESEIRAARQVDGCFQAASLDVPVGQRAESLGESLSEVESRYDHVETALTLQPAYQQLSERDQRLVYLRFYSELSQREIAEEFGVSQMQISRWLVRVLRSLRQYLSDDESFQLAS
ncbi:RNA polymerase sigma-B factor [Friedmanniella luteola]|uniref:RNA polymerase sigma-B factor n=1 Tax=Friedmanniella luteola TaxID=546871 RepID=A0A1H1N8V5_9ACTN|nr:sigma-70 family RNA polymerase sigma factor [Friedmanniella luteola]SDR95328.1 RNA polymerase sigma-B factor [Friedmanniella luteola]